MMEGEGNGDYPARWRWAEDWCAQFVCLEGLEWLNCSLCAEILYCLGLGSCMVRLSESPMCCIYGIRELGLVRGSEITGSAVVCTAAPSF